MKTPTQLFTVQNTLASQLATVNNDISNLNRKFETTSTIYERFQSLLDEETKHRQNAEKKGLLMNENLSIEVNKIKLTIDKINDTLISHLGEIKDDIMKDVRLNNSKFLSAFSSGIKRFEEYEKHLSNSHEEKAIKFHEIENKISDLEKVSSTQFNTIKNEINSNNSKINYLQNQINNNNETFFKELNAIKQEILLLKNEQEKINSNKENVNTKITKIVNDICELNEKNQKINQDVTSITLEVQRELKHYENVNKMLNENFMSIKSEVVEQIGELNSNSQNAYDKLKESLMNEIKQSNLNLEKFSMNIIDENKKFINYNQNQLKASIQSIRQLFDYTNDDVDVLKKKCDALENIIRNTRNEMLNNLNNIEKYFTERYDPIIMGTQQ